MRIPVYLDIDEASSSVTATHAKTGVQVFKLKCEEDTFSTFTRLDPSGNYDADNYWIGYKPADCVVFEQGLFNRNTKIEISQINFSTIKE